MTEETARRPRLPAYLPANCRMPGRYLSPSARMERVRTVRGLYAEWGLEWHRGLDLALWIEGGILAVPGISQHPWLQDKDLTWVRRSGSYEDWRDRCSRKRRINKRFRRIVIERAGGECFYCGCPVRGPGGFEIDHVIPVTRGGRSTLRNLVAACVRCNQDKSDQTPEEWRNRWYNVYFLKGVQWW